MSSVLITGLSAVGKSRTVSELIALGHRAVDLDAAEWSHWVPDDSEYAEATGEPLDWRWREAKVRVLLEAHEGTLFVAGTSTNQARLYQLLDHVVLLTVSTAVAVRRLASRTSNSYGKVPAELERELRLRPIVEPLLRQGACLELDTAVHSPAEVAAAIAQHASVSDHCRPA